MILKSEFRGLLTRFLIPKVQSASRSSWIQCIDLLCTPTHNMCLSRLLGLLLNEAFSKMWLLRVGAGVPLSSACSKITTNKPTIQKEPHKNQTKLPEIPDTRRGRHCVRPCYFGLLFLQNATWCQPRGSGLLPPKCEEAAQHEEHALRQDESFGENG